MPKLRLKRTPEEEAARQWRKRRRKEKHVKAARFGELDPSRTPAHDGQVEPGLDDLRFREKMADAFAEDERLDSVEAQMNDYSHIPKRWRSSSGKRWFSSGDYCNSSTYDQEEDELGTNERLNPQYMDDEEYCEWVRQGMYRRTHRTEFEEQERIKAEKQKLRAERHARKEEMRRLEREADARRDRQRRQEEDEKWIKVRLDYEKRWDALLKSNGVELTFLELPWPSITALSSPRKFKLDTLTEGEISNFVLKDATTSEEKKSLLRAALLLYHPDKFEARVIRSVKEEDHRKAREAATTIARHLNSLMRQT